MFSDPLTDAALKSLRYAAIRPYVESHGWRMKQLFRDVVVVFDRATGGTDQLLIPTDPGFDDFSDQMRSVVRKLAAVEKRSPQEVLQDLLSLDVDTLRFTAIETGRELGTLPLEQGVSLLEGARRSLLAAACTVLAPERTYHPRMSMGRAGEFVRLCELGQTELGSFTITVRCPLTVPGTAVENSGSNVPFARRTTETLMRSLTRLISAMDQGRMETVLENASGAAPITANLCEAMLLMQPERDDGSVAVSVSWAHSCPASIPGERVTLRREHFPQIRTVSRQLRGGVGPRREKFLAQVDELRGEMGGDGRRSGEVRLTVYQDDEPITARVNLNPAQYEIAIRAHESGRYVVALGLLDRGPRISTLTGLGEFEAVEQGRLNLELL
jgi:hypothetical protein